MSKSVVEIALRATGAQQVIAAFTGIRAASQGLKSAMTSVANFFGGPQAIGFAAAAAAAGMAAATRSAINYADAMTKAAQKTGTTTEEISALEYAARLSDVSVTDLQVGIKELVKWMGETGQTERSINDVLAETADQFARMADGPDKVALAVDRFGRSGQKLIPLLNGGSEGLRSMAEEARQFGIVVDTRTGKAAELFNDNLTRLQASARGLALTLAGSILPALTSMTQQVLAFMKSGTGFGELWDWIGKIVMVASGSLGAFIENLLRVSTFATSFAGALWETLSPPESFRQAWQDSQDAVTDYRENLAKIREVQAPAPENFESEVTVRRKTQELKLQELQYLRTGIDIRIAENRLITEKYATEIPAGEELNSNLIQQLNIEERLIDSRRQLTADFGDDLAENDRRKLEIEDKRALLAIERERRRIQDEPRIREQAEQERDWAGSYTGSTRDRFNDFERSKRMDDSQGLGAGAMAGIENSMMQLGSTAEMIGNTISTSIGGAVNGIATSMEGLIMGTMTWADGLRNVARTMLTTVVQAISKMFAEWIVARGLAAVKNMAFSTAEGATDAAAKTPGALMTSITSYGVAAAIGVAALIAAMAAFGGFQRGGYTGDGAPDQLAGAVHRGEYVMPAGVVDRIGVPTLDSMAAGLTVPVSRQGTVGAIATQPAPSAAPAASQGARQNLHVYLDRREWLNAVRDDVEGIAVDAMRRGSA